MRRAPGGRDTYGRVSGSSIPRPSVTNRQRSSSADCINRGSYLPSNRRTSSMERFRTSGSAVKHPRQSPRSSGLNIFSFQRASLLERKGIVKDLRPLNDRGYQKECALEIAEFLEERNFPFSITPASMMPPTKKDFERIFQFLYQMCDPKYEVQKIEDEAPKLLKSMGYPFMLNKSSFVTINRMSWPTLLGALMWLKDLHKMSAVISLSDYIAGDEFQNNEGHSILLSYLLASFVTGVDDEAKDVQVFSHLVAQRYDMDFSEDEVVNEIDKMKMLIEKESEEEEKYSSLCDGLKEVEEDIEKFKKYLQEMEIHIKQKTSTLKDFKEQRESKEQCLRDVIKAVAEKEQVYKAQGYDAEHAINFYKVTKSDLVEKLEQSKKTLKEEEGAAWDLKTELFQLEEDMDSLCRKFNPSWDELRGIFETIRSTLISIDIPSVIKMGKNFKITLPEFQLFPACIDDVTCVTKKVRQYIEEQRTYIQSIIGTQKEICDQQEMLISDINITEQMILAKKEQSKREVALQNEENQRELEAVEKKEKKWDSKFSKISEAHLKFVHDIENSNRSIADHEAKKEESFKEIQKLKESAEAARIDTLNFAQGIRERIEAQKKLVEEEMNKFLSQLAAEES